MFHYLWVLTFDLFVSHLRTSLNLCGDKWTRQCDHKLIVVVDCKVTIKCARTQKDEKICGKMFSFNFLIFCLTYWKFSYRFGSIRKFNKWVSLPVPMTLRSSIKFINWTLVSNSFCRKTKLQIMQLFPLRFTLLTAFARNMDWQIWNFSQATSSAVNFTTFSRQMHLEEVSRSLSFFDIVTFWRV